MLKSSPLAPKNIQKIKPINGIELYVYSAGLYNKKRLDLTLFLIKNKTTISEVFTKSSLRSCTLDWNEKNLKNKEELLDKYVGKKYEMVYNELLKDRDDEEAQQGYFYCINLSKHRNIDFQKIFPHVATEVL